jgi:hypothetical protein
MFSCELEQLELAETIGHRPGNALVIVRHLSRSCAKMLCGNIGDHHAGALARERQRRSAANAVRCPSYKRNSAQKRSGLVNRHFLLLALVRP